MLPAPQPCTKDEFTQPKFSGPHYGDANILMARHVFTLIVFIFVCGCASFQPKPLSPSQTASDFEARTLEGGGLRQFLETGLDKKFESWPPDRWDFEILAMAALYYNPDMDVARARWGVARAGVITAGGRPNPVMSLLGQHHSATGGGALSPWTAGMSLDIPVETAGKRGYRIQKAEHLSEAGRLNVAETAWQVRSRLRKDLLALYSFIDREKFLRDQLEIQQGIAGIFEQRVAVGESSRFEEARSRLDLDKMRLLLAETQKQMAEAHVSLADALGVPARALEGIRISFDSFDKVIEVADLKDIRRQALSGRPDILAALSEYEASQSALQLEIAKQYPDIHLGPGYEWDQGDNKWSLGFSVELPVLNRNEGPIEEAKARREESAARFTALQARVIGEIDKAEAAYNETLRKLKVADSLVSTERGRLQIIQRRFDMGESDRLALEEAKMGYSAMEIARFGALISAQEGLGALEDAVRRPLSPMGPLPAALSDKTR